MRFLFLLLPILLVGCFASTGTPVTMSFPQAPQSLKGSCDQLKRIPENSEKLSELADTVIINYSQYHECRVKVDGWNEWYDAQRRVFESIK